VRRVAVVGCGGSGKSYLAGEIAKLIGVSLTHLDAEYFDSEWRPLPMAQFACRQQELVTAHGWVIDGNYNSTLEIRLRAADTVIFMDMSTATCLRGIVGRQLRQGHGQDRDNGAFNRITFGVIRYVLGYRRKMRPRVLAKIAEFAPHARLIVLTSRQATSAFLAQLTAESCTARHSPACSLAMPVSTAARVEKPRGDVGSRGPARPHRDSTAVLAKPEAAAHERPRLREAGNRRSRL
jgi:adenylate kinase family enzyme